MTQTVGVGTLINRSFVIWGKNAGTYCLLGGLVQFPLILVVIALLGALRRPNDILYINVAASMVQVVMTQVAAGAITYGVVEELRGRRASLGACLRIGVQRLLPVLGVVLLTGFFIFLGFFALIVGAFVVMCMLWLAVPVAVVERPGVVASLGRSRVLTKGFKGAIFGLIFVIGSVSGFFSGIISGVVNALSIELGLVVGLFVGGVANSLQAVAMAVAYHDIRQSKEGVDVAELAAVFE
jgi:hypothetical protein